MQDSRKLYFADFRFASMLRPVPQGARPSWRRASVAHLNESEKKNKIRTSCGGNCITHPLSSPRSVDVPAIFPAKLVWQDSSRAAGSSDESNRR